MGLSLMRGLRKHCSLESDLRIAQRTLVHRFISNHAPEPLIAALEREIVFEKVSQAKPRNRNRHGSLWLVLPYHPVFEMRTVRGCIQKFLKSDATANLIGFAFQDSCKPVPQNIGVSWKNHLGFAQHVVKRIS